uniref:Uncharacterized protein n=1 Tax=Lactuca sativa TaxID=4236 RepID=A0A9R1XRW6_LACSA|nr:hypothetical protein LSAT_V11C300137630 [Lactuca sativa]
MLDIEIHTLSLKHHLTRSKLYLLLRKILGYWEGFNTKSEYLKKGRLVNVLLSDENLRNSSMADEIRAQVYCPNESQSDEEADKEVVKNKYRIHDPNTPWDKMEPKVGDMFESPI